eukprot:1159186-Pelagomonas_calceolata.AAC.2
MQQQTTRVKPLVKTSLKRCQAAGTEPLPMTYTHKHTQAQLQQQQAMLRQQQEQQQAAAAAAAWSMAMSAAMPVPLMPPGSMAPLTSAPYDPLAAAGPHTPPGPDLLRVSSCVIVRKEVGE